MTWRTHWNSHHLMLLMRWWLSRRSNKKHIFSKKSEFMQRWRISFLIGLEIKEWLISPVPPPWWMYVHWPQTLLYLLHRVAPSLKLSLEHLSSHRQAFDASALWYLPPRKFKGRLETLSTFLTWHGDIVIASRLPDVWEDLMCLLPTVVSAHFKLRPGSGRTLNDRENEK